MIFSKSPDFLEILDDLLNKNIELNIIENIEKLSLLGMDYNEFWNIDNGITLSEKAHKEFHRKYGKQNNTLSQLKEFLCY